MQGAREFATLFADNKKRGRLCPIAGSHARGKTFHLYIVPEGFVVPTGMHPAGVPGAVEVYGITGGQPGWTETYGWLHRGKWEHDFAALVESRRAEIAANNARRAAEDERRKDAERQKIADLLANYK